MCYEGQKLMIVGQAGIEMKKNQTAWLVSGKCIKLSSCFLLMSKMARLLASVVATSWPAYSLKGVMI